MIDRKRFFDLIRPHFGSLKQSQVDGFEAVLGAWDASELTDRRWLAYMLATAWWETARTMQPIAEYGKGKGRKYGKPDVTTQQVYYGRGFVQLTWKENYENMSKVVGADLVYHPDLAMQLDYASKIMFHGMVNGSFTGKKLSHYFNGPKADWRNARRIINGLDKADTIADLGRIIFWFAVSD